MSGNYILDTNIVIVLFLVSYILVQKNLHELRKI